MTDHERAGQPAPLLNVERALEATTRRRQEGERACSTSFNYPKELGNLMSEAVRLDSVDDAETVVRGVKADITASYAMDDPEAAAKVRSRSLSWLDWLTQRKAIVTDSFVNTDIARLAAEHGDVAVVRRIFEKPETALWPEHAKDGAFRLQDVPTRDLMQHLPGVATILTSAPESAAPEMREVVMPILSDLVKEATTSRNLTVETVALRSTANELFAIKTPEALALRSVLIGALPLGGARHDVLTDLARQDESLVSLARDVQAWHRVKARMAEEVLAPFLAFYSDNLYSRKYIDFAPENGDAVGSEHNRLLGNIIVDRIPPDSVTSPMETSVAHATLSFSSGNVYDSLLTAVRRTSRHADFNFASPRFGFAACFVDDIPRHDFVTIMDAHLPARGLRIDFSQDPFKGIAYRQVRFLCRLLQAAKDERRIHSGD
ncbi:MAG TPA: hypothetical protein VF733_00450 [Candidatus Saccharimonadales bacterium]